MGINLFFSCLIRVIMFGWGEKCNISFSIIIMLGVFEYGLFVEIG